MLSSEMSCANKCRPASNSNSITPKDQTSKLGRALRHSSAKCAFMCSGGQYAVLHLSSLVRTSPMPTAASRSHSVTIREDESWQQKACVKIVSGTAGTH